MSEALKDGISEVSFSVVVHENDQLLGSTKRKITLDKQKAKRPTRRPLRKIAKEKIAQFIEFILAWITGRKNQDR